MLRFGLELSLLELDVIWRSQSMGDLPLILDVPSPGATHTERADIEATVWAHLIERDLADDHGHPTASVVSALQVIAVRRLSLHLRTFGSDALGAILAQRGRRTVLAVLDDQRFRLAYIADTRLPDTLLSLLPDLPAGPGHSVNVHIDDFTRATQAQTTYAALAALTSTGLNPSDARTLLDMTTGSTRAGQIAVEARTRDGLITRSTHIIAFHDTPRGRYQTLRNAHYLTITPATTTTLTRAIHTLIHTTQTATTH